MENQIKNFYNSLPEASFPKKEFILAAAKACGVSPHTVKAWIHDGKRPSAENLAILKQLSNGAIQLQQAE